MGVILLAVELKLQDESIVCAWVERKLMPVATNCEICILIFFSLHRINDFKFIAPESVFSAAAGANAKLRYQITSGNKGGVFDIEPEVGTIFVAQPLDYEQQKRFKLLVLASDGKWEDYAAVVVTVVNKNDEAPVFSMNEYYGSVTEELDGSPVFVLQVNASAPCCIILSSVVCIQ